MYTDEVETKNPFLRLKSRYLVFATALGVNSVVALPLFVVGEAGWLPEAIDPAVITALEIGVRCAIAAIILWIVREEGLVLKHLFGPVFKPIFTHRRPRFSILYGLILVLSLLVFSLGSFSLFFALAALALPDYAAQILQSASVLEEAQGQFPYLSHALMLILVLAIAPVVEEFIFRGILLQRWATKWGVGKALLASSLLFGLLHPNNPIGLTLFGLAMGLLYIRTRSLWVPIVFHALNNLSAVGLAGLSNLAGGDEVSVTVADVQEGWKVGLLLVLVSAPFLWRFVRRSWPEPAAMIPYLVNSDNYG